MSEHPVDYVGEEVTFTPVRCSYCFRSVPLYHVTIDGEPTGDGGIYSGLFCRSCIDEGRPA